MTDPAAAAILFFRDWRERHTRVAEVATGREQ
jgi:hypothetical protein